MHVSNLMTKDVASATTDATLAEVARLMAERDCGAIPIVDDAGLPVGIVSDRDIVLRTLGNGRESADLTAGDVMSVPCVTVSASADLQACLTMMESNQIRRVVVVDDDGKCTGIVSQADIALHASRRQAGSVLEHVSSPNGIARPDGDQSRLRSAANTAKEHPITVGTVLATVGVIGIAAWYFRRRSTATVASTVAAVLASQSDHLQKLGEKLGSKVAAVVGDQIDTLGDRFGALSGRLKDTVKDRVVERFA